MGACSSVSNRTQVAPAVVSTSAPKRQGRDADDLDNARAPTPRGESQDLTLPLHAVDAERSAKFRTRKLSRDKLVGDKATAAQLAALVASTDGDSKELAKSFRKRKLSKDNLVGDDATAAKLAVLIASSNGEPEEESHPGQCLSKDLVVGSTVAELAALTADDVDKGDAREGSGSRPEMTARLQVTATAETAAEAARAAAKAGHILFVATEFEETEDSFMRTDSSHLGGVRKGESIMDESFSFRNRGSAALAELADHHTVGSFSCHGAEPGHEGVAAKINQDCACPRLTQSCMCSPMCMHSSALMEWLLLWLSPEAHPVHASSHAHALQCTHGSVH